MDNTEIIELLDNAKYRYSVNKTMTFIVNGMDVGKWDLYDSTTGKIGHLRAKGRGNKVEIYPGFQWDGCTFIGQIYENDITLKASAFHDILYHVAKNKNFKAKYNLFQADIWFRKYMSELYDNKSFLPWIYYFGITFLGLPWKFGYNRGWFVSGSVLD